ncbi:MAG TPA: MFS transporter [Planctomycetes bacterium]|nr:MFS transporter [Planctomycetota bacterium]
MSTNRVEIVERNLDAYLASAKPAATQLPPDAPLRRGSHLTARKAVELFEDQVLSRALDVAARELKKTGRSFYTISSAGHEQNAAIGAQLRSTDPAFLHYRSGAFMMSRWRRRAGSTPLFDTLLSLTASRDDPISQGRHKVWGSRPDWVPPQTSTIASHISKAMGMAWALPRARRLAVDSGLPMHSIVACSFGDASANHASALSGIHAARYIRRRGSPVPILFICEDNGRGISVKTPPRWIQDSFSHLDYLDYYGAQGEIDEIWDTARQAILSCRNTKTPTFLHLRCERLWGHAGSDVETAYRSLEDIEEVESRDPLLRNARRLIETGAATPLELAAIVRDTRERVRAASEEAAARPKLSTLAEVIAPLAPYDEDRCRADAIRSAPPERRAELFGKRFPEEAHSATRRTMAAHLNAALTDEMAKRPETLVFGEDVGKKGGVYGITRGLQERFGEARVFDSLLDETTILGVAQGAAHAGFLPIPEIQYLAYIHNALDQIRSEASTLSFFSAGQFTNPMVVRIAGFAYQKGFGGHFHNDNSIGALRDIPGLVLAAPSRGDDAARMLRGCLAMAHVNGRVVAFLEPIALYHERDLHEEGDGLWLTDYPAPDGSEESVLLPGEVRCYGPEEADLLIVSYANGLRLSLQAAKRLEDEAGKRVRVLDLRWLNPLPLAALAREASRVDRLLVVDECRATGGGIAGDLISHLVESDYPGRIRSVRAADSFVPLGTSTAAVLVGVEDILEGAREVLS